MNMSFRTPAFPAIRARRFSFAPSVALSITLAGAVTACTAAPPTAPSSTSSSSAVQVDQTEAVIGVPDNGLDPAVVALDIDGTELCSGTLIAPDVVLTARHCVSTTPAQIACPATTPQISANRPPSTIHVLVGDDVATAQRVANGLQIFTPSSDEICGEDIALVVLDSQVPGIEPLDVSTTGVATGDHVTSIGYGRLADGDPAGKKLLREHVGVLDTSAAEFVVGEATCQGDSGGPALDETSGEIVGVVSRGGATCDGPGAHNVYTRTDVFETLIAQALGASATKGKKTNVDGGPKPVHDPVGGTCKAGSDCASGICVTSAATPYCTRSCGTGDRCPAHYHCTASDEADGGDAKVCIATAT
jgi:secreted trypsin-like serine protease